MAELSLERKINQLIISRLDGEGISSPAYRDTIVRLAEKGIGGFILFGGAQETVAPFISRLQKNAEIPLFIASDIERGAGQQVKGATIFPGQMAYAAALDRRKDEDAALLQSIARAVACEAIDAGINMPLIPVLDVNSNPDNPIVCTRAFSDRPEDVAWFGSRCIEALQSFGLISCAKHFPGHGRTSADSHISLPVISASREQLMKTDIVPFARAVEIGVHSIMVGHLSVPAIDDAPASLSRKVISGLLRRELGFRGLVLTDALNMHALKGLDNVPVRCINAGADIILHPADVDATAREMIDAVLAGTLREETITLAVERIISYKQSLRNVKNMHFDRDEHSRLSKRVSQRAVTCIRGLPDNVPLKDPEKITLIFSDNTDGPDLSALKGYIKKYVPFETVRGDEVQDTVVIALFTDVAAWRGSSGLKEAVITRVKKIVDSSRKSIVISFGSPYVLRHFPRADMLIAVYDSSAQAQQAVVNCLNGTIGFTGRLPVRLADF